MAHKKVTSPKIATIASRALRSNNTSKNTKKIAGSALAQTPGKHRGKNRELIQNASPKVLGLRSTAIKTRVSWFEGKRVYSSRFKSARRGYYGTYHQMSAKQPPRHIDGHDTADKVASIAKGFIGRRLRQRELVG